MSTFNGQVDSSRRTYPLNQWGQATQEYTFGTRHMTGNRVDHHIKQHDGPNTMPSLLKLGANVGPGQRPPSSREMMMSERMLNPRLRQTANSFSVHGTRQSTTHLTKRLRLSFPGQNGNPTVNVYENGFKHGPVSAQPTQPIRQASILSEDTEVWDRNMAKTKEALKVFFPIEMPLFRLAHLHRNRKRFPTSVNLLSISHLNARMKQNRAFDYDKNDSGLNNLSDMKKRLSFHGICAESTISIDTMNRKAIRVAFVVDGTMTTFNFWNECHLKPASGNKLYFILVRVRQGFENLERRLRSGHALDKELKQKTREDLKLKPSYLRLEPFVGHRPPPAKLFSSFGLGDDASKKLYGDETWIGRSFYVGHVMDRQQTHVRTPELSKILYPDNVTTINKDTLVSMNRLRINVE